MLELLLPMVRGINIVDARTSPCAIEDDANAVGLNLVETKMRFLWGHSRIPLRHLHILMTEHLADGLHRHTCLQRNEAGERVSCIVVEIGKSVLFSTSTSKAFWMESNNCSMSLLVSTASLLLFSFGCFSALC